MLLNLVKLRYSDAPVFLDVSSIITQYSLETSVNARASWNEFFPADSQALGVTGRYVDRPTITYSPLTGEQFTRNLLTPIPPGAIFSLVQAGWPIDRIFVVCVQSVNGIDNRAGTMALSREADPDFYRLISALRRLQQSGGVGMRVERREDKLATIMFFEHPSDERAREDMATVRQLLGLATDANEFALVYGRLSKSPGELAVLSRSILEILMEMSTHVDVPQTDLDEGRVLPVLAKSAGAVPEVASVIQVRCSEDKPTDAYVSVKYRDHWFWIDDRDPRSKGMLTFLMILFSLTETGGPAGTPLVTIPAG
ncbi:MAG: hypothetical protein O7E52_13340 [Candidatus Poribacteria bacterium]|nr:hypothetical protein [Candidatus Poribacteria bacterium]